MTAPPTSDLQSAVGPQVGPSEIIYRADGDTSGAHACQREQALVSWFQSLTDEAPLGQIHSLPNSQEFQQLNLGHGGAPTHTRTHTGGGALAPGRRWLRVTGGGAARERPAPSSPRAGGSHSANFTRLGTRGVYTRWGSRRRLHHQRGSPLPHEGPPRSPGGPASKHRVSTTGSAAASSRGCQR